MDANALRRAFTSFFTDRGHTAVPSSGLIPHHPTAPLFSNAGMNQFVPYFLGEEPAPYARATSIQKCVRTADIDIIGTTSRHCTFFEMLGNFSFGDYFKAGAIPLAWELATEVLGFDGDRIWVTVYLDDDEAAEIWRDAVGVPAERIQRLGEADNFWEMQKGGTGPCGPNSELYLDRGPEHGEAGGPEHGGEDRYVEFWNLVFMQYARQADGSLSPLPKQNVDTGAGFERLLALTQGVDTVFETDVMAPILEDAQSITGRRYGDDEKVDVSLRILADHARAVSFMVGDGVFPSNEDRGYVARRLIRRMVRHAWQLGVEAAITPRLLSTVASTLGEAWPELTRNLDATSGIVAREEEQFRRTLQRGTTILDSALAAGSVPGSVAFELHDTYGFPVELTQEIAAERGAEVDVDGFREAMAEQRRRAKAARKAVAGGEVPVERYRSVLDAHGPTTFVGYHDVEAKATVLEVIELEGDRVEVFLDRTPFYAEGGGQVGDTGRITTATGSLDVIDTTYALPGLHRHLCRTLEGDVEVGQAATAAIDAPRRDAIRRNHTGTHLLHWALREVLGPQVRQQSSYVGPDRLRFDINHPQPLTSDELERVERLVNEQVLSNAPVAAEEMPKAAADEAGAIAFFGDKYGEVVRVLRAGHSSMELCGGTHVDALGTIGPLKIVYEGSIGSGLRRIEAVTGFAALERFRDEERALDRIASTLRTTPSEVVEAAERVLERQRQLEDELKALRAQSARGEARSLAAEAVAGVVIARRDGLQADQLRELALAVRSEPDVRAAFLVGSPDGERVALVGAAEKGAGLAAGELIGAAAKVVGGGGGGKPELAVAGGRDASKIDDAIALLRERAT